ncbi:hypothetical protein FGB62_28g136 [Gracilaria domingensis]|nr:hypothetical protein FGB62_28g136 [Gracilaria domingensis]
MSSIWRRRSLVWRAGDDNCEGARFAVQLAGKEVGGVIAAALLDDVEIVDDDLERVDGGHDERHQALLAQGFPAGGHVALGVERVYAKALQLEHGHAEVEVVQGEHVGDDSEGALQGVALGGGGGVQRFWPTAGEVGDCVGAGRDGARHGDAVAAGARQAAVGAAVAEGLLVEAESRNVDHHCVNITKYDKEREEAWRGWGRGGGGGSGGNKRRTGGRRESSDARHAAALNRRAVVMARSGSIGAERLNWGGAAALSVWARLKRGVSNAHAARRRARLRAALRRARLRAARWQFGARARADIQRLHPRAAPMAARRARRARRARAHRGPGARLRAPQPRRGGGHLRGRAAGGRVADRVRGGVHQQRRRADHRVAAVRAGGEAAGVAQHARVPLRAAHRARAARAAAGAPHLAARVCGRQGGVPAAARPHVAPPGRAARGAERGGARAAGALHVRAQRVQAPQHGVRRHGHHAHVAAVAGGAGRRGGPHARVAGVCQRERARHAAARRAGRAGRGGGALLRVLRAQQAAARLARRRGLRHARHSGRALRRAGRRHAGAAVRAAADEQGDEGRAGRDGLRGLAAVQVLSARVFRALFAARLVRGGARQTAAMDRKARASAGGAGEERRGAARGARSAWQK